MRFKIINSIMYLHMNSKIKQLRLLLCVLILNSSLLTLTSNKTYASISGNDNWTIDIKDLNIAPQTFIDKNKQTATTDNTPGGKNYKIKLGFEDLSPLSPFSLNISNTLIDYGTLSPTNPVYRTSNLTIINTGTKGFVIKAYEDHPLAILGSNSFIPDSTCDNGSCSEMTAAPWINTLTYGFGYRCDNVTSNNCPIEFNQNNYYRKFSNKTQSETEANLISTKYPSPNQEIQITYKVNISATQPSGSYSNTITYIAIPDY